MTAPAPSRLKALDHREKLVQAGFVAGMLRRLPLDELLEAIAIAHAGGPIIHPTEYRENVDRMKEDEQLLRILQRAQQELNALPWPEMAAAGGAS